MAILSLFAPLTAVYGAEDSDFKESTQLLINPDCGFYKAFSGKLMANSDSSPVSKSKMADYAGDYGLFHLRIGLEDFSANAGARDREIDSSALNGVRSMLNALRELKMSAIIRFSYNVNGDEDSSGNYLENEPSISLIVKHIKSLGSVISEYNDVILGVESGMVGPWGEQHSTTLGNHKESNAGTYHKIVQAWLESTPSDMGITVRRPLYFTYWANKQYSLDLSISDLADFDSSKYVNATRVGVYNDGYLGSSTDLGTFTNRSAEVAFIGKQAQNTYYGGEVVADKKTGSIGEYNAVSYLEKEGYVTHTSYLNIDWNYEYVISKWQSNTYKGSDAAYKNKTTEFVFVNNRLGYRHLVTGISAPNRARAGETVALSLEIENKGFAKMLKKPVATVTVKNEIKTESFECELDLTAVDSLDSKTFILQIPLNEKIKGESEIYLNLQTVYGRNIYFANDSSLAFNSELNAYKLCTLQVEKAAAEKESYLVTFDANYGRVVSGKTSQIVKAGESAVAPVVERNGYQFVGWSCDFSCINQDTNVVAIWEKIEDSSSAEENDSSVFEDLDKESNITSNNNGSSANTNSGCSAGLEGSLFGLCLLSLAFLTKIIKKSAV